MIVTERKISTLKDFLVLRDKLKKKGKKLVFSNGCFDIVHLGHIDYLQKARNLGDFLVLGLNSDKSVRMLKGEGRPIIDEASRARLMASMEFIDAVILFDDLTPKELINAILPDILVKGDDYLIKDIVGSNVVIEHGGEVKTISLVKGYSTSKIIEKIKS
ncbi:D-glycero-beta-D-manno-heptose 1-phosphate adenylyltransferase [Hyphobacterium sp. CCMP332]|nr:D-glycero-beta-D-manno-heptose 1-phosphate adenylyltransferase [Hyphobacterium sp. CCMP332]